MTEGATCGVAAVWGIPLDGRNKELSYPAMIEGPDGALHLAYTFHRRAIKYGRLARGWIDRP